MVEILEHDLDVLRTRLLRKASDYEVEAALCPCGFNSREAQELRVTAREMRDRANGYQEKKLIARKAVGV